VRTNGEVVAHSLVHVTCQALVGHCRIPHYSIRRTMTRSLADRTGDLIFVVRNLESRRCGRYCGGAAFTLNS
jgi:hypothetical protein